MSLWIIQIAVVMLSLLISRSHQKKDPVLYCSGKTQTLISVFLMIGNEVLLRFSLWGWSCQYSKLYFFNLMKCNFFMNVQIWFAVQVWFNLIKYIMYSNFFQYRVDLFKSHIWISPTMETWNNIPGNNPKRRLNHCERMCRVFPRNLLHEYYTYC